MSTRAAGAASSRRPAQRGSLQPRSLQLEGGSAWFRIAKLQNGRFLWDIRQEWSVVFNWEFQALDNQGLTPQQAMDKEFAQEDIPIKLRPQLVGEGPAGG